MGVAFVLAGWVVLPAGCGHSNEAAREPDTTAAAPSAATAITLHVKDMIGRQGIT
jgi:hypothetical protein